MTAALILAAGVVPPDSKRKPTEEISGASSLRRIIITFRQAGVRRIVVITGFNAEETENNCGKLGAVFLRNDTYESGDMLGSVKMGLDYLKDKCEKTFITPAAYPLFSLDTIVKMEEASEPVVIPMFQNKTGHPLLLSRAIFDKVLDYECSGGIAGALTGSEVDRRFLDVPDAGILIDTQSTEDICNVVKNNSMRKTRAEAKIQLSRERGFFGPGMLLLLNLVQEVGALKHAAQRMGMSYQKAINLIANAEEQLGFKLLRTVRGRSPTGGNAAVTEEALDLMRKYETFEMECDAAIQTLFEKYFSCYKQ